MPSATIPKKSLLSTLRSLTYDKRICERAVRRWRSMMMPIGLRSAMSTPETPTRREASDEARARGGRTLKLQFAAVCTAIFSFAYALNAATPMVADDFTFAYIFRTTMRVESIADILSSQWIFYLTRNGRIVGGFFAQLAVLVGKPTFNVLNSVAFLLLVLLMYFNANGLRRTRISLLIGIPVLLWFALPSFGQSMLFVAAASNYLWLAVLVLTALLPFRIHAQWPAAVPDSLLTAVAIIPLGVLAGFTNENVGPTVVLLMIAFLALYKRKGIPIPKWSITGTVAALIGAVMLVGSPGNYATLSEIGATAARPTFPVLFDRFAAITHAIFLDNLFGLTTLFLLLSVIVLDRRRASGRDSIVIGAMYLGAAFVATYAMVLSPFFPPRAWTGILVFAITGVGVAYSALDFESVLVRRLVLLVLSAGVVMFAVKFAYVYTADLRVTARQWSERIALIEAEKARGNLNVVVPPIEALTTYNGAYGIADLDTDPGEWPNADMARYFGLESIRAEVATESPDTP